LNNLRDIIPVGSKDKLGILSNKYEKENPYNMMGYDGAGSTIKIPLYYVYTTIIPLVFHVGNTNNNPFANDN
jgi:hypothetical protein